MTCRAEILTREINENSSKSLAQINEESNTKPEQSKKLEVNNFLDLQRNQAYKLAFGIHISERNSTQITFDFTPNVDGVLSKDIYQVTLAKSPDLVLKSAKLPASKSLKAKFYDFNIMHKSKIFPHASYKDLVIPLEKLALENLPKVDQFIRRVKTGLDGWMSRFEQMTKLSKDEGDAILDVNCNFDLTEISLAINLSADETQEEIILHLVMHYM